MRSGIHSLRRGILVGAIIFLFGFLFVFSSQAATLPVTGQTGATTGTTPGTAAPGIDFTIQDVFNLLQRFACWTTQIAILVVVVFVLYYGWMFLQSRGDPTGVTAARKALLWGIIGILIIFGTYTIIATVTKALGGQAKTFPIDCSGVSFQ